MYTMSPLFLFVSVVLLANWAHGQQDPEKGVDGLPIPQDCKTIMKQGIREGKKYHETSVRTICEQHKCKISAKDSLGITYPEMMKFLMNQFQVFKQKGAPMPFNVQKTADDVVNECFKGNQKYMAIQSMCICNSQDCIDKEKTKNCIGKHVTKHVLPTLGWLERGCKIAKEAQLVNNIINYMNKRAQEMPNEPICRK